MHLRRKQVEPLGFKGSGMWDDSPSHWIYYRKDPKRRTVTIISNYCPQTISQFKLDEKQWRAFTRGTLSLVPPNCCCASGRKHLDDPHVYFEGEFKDIRHVRKLLEAVDTLTEANPTAEAQTSRSTKTNEQS